MTSHPAGVTVGRLLENHPEAFGLDLDLLAGSGGLTRRITNPYVQKTGLALAGFHEYLRPGRVLVFGNSEVRYLESLQPAERSETMRKVCQHDVPCNLAILVEIAARNQLLRARGHDAARRLADRLERHLQLAGIDDIDDLEIDTPADPGDQT